MVERAPWWAPDAVNERVIHRLHVELVRWIDEIGRDPEHRSRMALDRLLRQFAEISFAVFAAVERGDVHAGFDDGRVFDIEADSEADA